MLAQDFIHGAAALCDLIVEAQEVLKREVAGSVSAFAPSAAVSTADALAQVSNMMRVGVLARAVGRF